MKYFLVLAFLVVSACQADENSGYPKWTLNPAESHSSYCITVKGNIDESRKIAAYFASHSFITEPDEELTGYEEVKSISDGGIVDSNYEQQFDKITIGQLPQVEIVDEVIVVNQLCVLVKPIKKD